MVGRYIGAIHTSLQANCTSKVEVSRYYLLDVNPLVQDILAVHSNFLACVLPSDVFRSSTWSLYTNTFASICTPFQHNISWYQSELLVRPNHLPLCWSRLLRSLPKPKYNFLAFQLYTSYARIRYDRPERGATPQLSRCYISEVETVLSIIVSPNLHPRTNSWYSSSSSLPKWIHHQQRRWRPIQSPRSPLSSPLLEHNLMFASAFSTKISSSTLAYSRSTLHSFGNSSGLLAEKFQLPQKCINMSGTLALMKVILIAGLSVMMQR